MYCGTRFQGTLTWRTAGWADGAGIASASDLAEWGYDLLAGDTILTTDMLEAMTSAAEQADEGNGLGIFAEDEPAKGAGYPLSHTGGDMGYESVMTYYPDLDVSVAIIVNGETADDAPAAEDLAREAAQLVAG